MTRTGRRRARAKKTPSPAPPPAPKVLTSSVESNKADDVWGLMLSTSGLVRASQDKHAAAWMLSKHMVKKMGGHRSPALPSTPKVFVCAGLNVQGLSGQGGACPSCWHEKAHLQPESGPAVKMLGAVSVQVWGFRVPL